MFVAYMMLHCLHEEVNVNDIYLYHFYLPFIMKCRWSYNLFVFMNVLIKSERYGGCVCAPISCRRRNVLHYETKHKSFHGKAHVLYILCNAASLI